jgi:hypothetical protein
LEALIVFAVLAIPVAAIAGFFLAVGAGSTPPPARPSQPRPEHSFEGRFGTQWVVWVGKAQIPIHGDLS